MKAYLKKQKETVELLEEVCELEKRLRKYKSFDPIDSWSTRWVASPIAYLFPEERREEWLGDLYELNREMLRKNYPRPILHSINVIRTGGLIVSAVQIKLSDLISLGGKLKM
jgi:hypothetical protein